MHAELETGVLPLRLKRGEETRILAGHQWAFSNELEEVPKGEEGAPAALYASGGRLLGFGFYNPKSLIAFRMLSPKEESLDSAFFLKRLKRALDLRRRLGLERSFRLCFGESDGLPGLVADKYEDVLVLQVLAAGMERCLDAVAGALVELFSPKGIYLKNDHPARALEGLRSERRTLMGEVPERVTISEDGLQFVTPILGGQKTGFYFDQRENRAFLGPFCKGRSVLDLYCYTGAFALNAARHGAAEVLGLDSSASAVSLAAENAKLNGLEAKCRFDSGDAQEVLQAFAGGGQPIEPDLIVLDPPSLVPSRKHLAKALRTYARINALALRCLEPGGLLATSTCSHHVGLEDFVAMLRHAAAKAPKSVRLLELRGQAKDHPVLLSMPETEYLHFALLEVI